RGLVDGDLLADGVLRGAQLVDRALPRRVLTDDEAVMVLAVGEAGLEPDLVGLDVDQLVELGVLAAADDLGAVAGPVLPVVEPVHLAAGDRHHVGDAVVHGGGLAGLGQVAAAVGVVVALEDQVHAVLLQQRAPLVAHPRVVTRAGGGVGGVVGGRHGPLVRVVLEDALQPARLGGHQRGVALVVGVQADEPYTLIVHVVDGLPEFGVAGAVVRIRELGAPEGRQAAAVLVVAGDGEVVDLAV